MSVDEALARMEGLRARLAPADGVRAFNDAYLRVTRRVRDGLSGFADPDSPPAWTSSSRGATLTRWTPRRRPRRGGRGWTRAPTAPWRRAARARRHERAHRYDLPIALAATATQRGIELRDASPAHADFQRINDILATVERELRPAGLAAHVEAAVALWEVERARDRAWDDARMRAAWPAARSARASWTAQPPREAGCWSKTRKADQVLSHYVSLSRSWIL